jgi:probable F420-dependent oxidoreductase
MSTRTIRFGVVSHSHAPVKVLTEEARHAEQAGFDVFLLADHLGMNAPLPPLVSVAAAAPSLRVGTHVLNSSFYRPALLARDLAGVDSATNGRLEIGLGSGYVEAEFVEAGLPFPSPGERVDHLARTATELRRLLSDPAYSPAPVQAPPPIMIGGNGDRVLTTAAHHADIVAFNTLGTRDDLADRVRYLTRQAGDRADQLELSFGFFQTGLDDPEDLSIMRLLIPGADAADLKDRAVYLGGPVERAAETIGSMRDELGITYFTLNYTPSVRWESLAQLVAAVG